MLREEKELKTL